MNAKSTEIIKGLIAVILLIIYFLVLGFMILEVYKWDSARGELVFNNNMIWTANVVGGLVAAVIVANLAISKPGETPLSQVKVMSQEYGKSFMSTIIWIYIIIWLIVGLGAFFVGVIQRPEVSENLNEIGKSWLGILLGSTYAWFGIDHQ
jgi:uncharacterized membrane protein